MKYFLLSILLITTLGATSVTLAANSLTASVKIKRIDAAQGAGGAIRIHTEPRPNISILGCSSDFWLVLKPDVHLFEETYAILLSAKLSNSIVSVVADDGGNSGLDFCNLSRVILE